LPANFANGFLNRRDFLVTDLEFSRATRPKLVHDQTGGISFNRSIPTPRLFTKPALGVSGKINRQCGHVVTSRGYRRAHNLPQRGCRSSLAIAGAQGKLKGLSNHGLDTDLAPAPVDVAQFQDLLGVIDKQV